MSVQNDVNACMPGALPLSGIRVLDLTHVLAGPLATMLLGDLGAEVIKVERPGTGDETRGIPPSRAGESHYFLSVNRNKQSIAVDLKDPRGLELVLGLVEHSDVLVENFRPGVAERLGLDAESVRKRNANIIYCSISAFGQDGPWADRSGFDIAVQAMSGAMTVSGDADDPPMRTSIPLADLAGGLFATIGVLGALVAKRNTGRGRTIDVAMLDSMMGLMGYMASYYLMTGESPQRVGGGHVSIVPYGAYKAADGYLVIATLTETFWPKLCHALGLPELASDPQFATNHLRLQRRDEIDALITQTLAARSVAEWCDRLAAADVPHGPVLTVADAVEHEQLTARQMVRQIDHPAVGPMRIMGPALKFVGEEALPVLPPPLMGADTRAVLKAVLGLSDGELADFEKAGVIAGPTKREDEAESPNGSLSSFQPTTAEGRR